jgi:N-acetylglucosamine-6-sulfatase
MLRMGYQAVRTERWKYLHYVELPEMDELYDLASDPFEMNNLVQKPSSSRALDEMKIELKRLLKETAGEDRTARTSQ